MEYKNLINIDDLVRQRLGGAEEPELPGAWSRMEKLLEKEEKKRPLGFLWWGRGRVYLVAAGVLIAAITAGGYYTNVLNGVRLPGKAEVALSGSASNVHTSNRKSNTGTSSATTPAFNNNSTPESAFVTACRDHKNGGSENGDHAKDRIANGIQSKTEDGAISRGGSAGTPSTTNSQNSVHTGETVLSEVTEVAGASGDNGNNSDHLQQNRDSRHHEASRAIARHGYHKKNKTGDRRLASRSSSSTTESMEGNVPSEVGKTTNQTAGQSHNNAASTTTNGKVAQNTGAGNGKVNKPDQLKQLASGVNTVNVSAGRIHKGGKRNNATALVTGNRGTHKGNVVTTGIKADKLIDKNNLQLNATNEEETVAAGIDRKDNAIVFNSKSTKTGKYKRINNYLVKIPRAANGSDISRQDTISIHTDSMRLAEKEDDENDGVTIPANTVAKKGKQNTETTRHKNNTTAGNQRRTFAGNQFAAGNASVTGKRKQKATITLPTTSDNETETADATANANKLSKVFISPLNPWYRPIVPQANTKLMEIPSIAFAAEKKAGKSHFWEDLNDKLNEIKRNVGSAQFTPGITAGINGTFFGPNDFRGFQFGFTGLFEIDDHWSILGELKYFHRMNNNYSISESYVTPTDSVVNYFNFSTLHSFEMPWAIRYTNKGLTFYGGTNILYSMPVNTGAAPVTYSLAHGPVSTKTNATISEADFTGRFGVGYTFGCSYQVAPKVCIDLRNVQTIWDNAGTSGSKSISSQLYKSPSLQISVQYRLGGKNEK